MIILSKKQLCDHLKIRQTQFNSKHSKKKGCTVLDNEINSIIHKHLKPKNLVDITEYRQIYKFESIKELIPIYAEIKKCKAISRIIRSKNHSNVWKSLSKDEFDEFKQKQKEQAFIQTIKKGKKFRKKTIETLKDKPEILEKAIKENPIAFQEYLSKTSPETAKLLNELIQEGMNQGIISTNIFNF